MSKIILAAIIILSLAGIVDSGYALNQHYAPPDVSSCDVNETTSCTAVNQSRYSEVAGVPVAGIGIAGYLALGGLSGLALIRRSSARTLLQALAIMTLGALAVSLYLTYIEIFILKAVCPLCVISLALVTAVAALSVTGAFRGSRGQEA